MSRKGTSQQDIGALPVPPYQRRNPSPESKRIVVARPTDANLLAEATEAGRRDSTSQKSRLQSSQHQSTQKSPPDSLEARPTDAEMTAAAVVGRRASKGLSPQSVISGPPKLKPNHVQPGAQRITGTASDLYEDAKPSSHSNISGRSEIERDKNRPASVKPGAQRIAGIAGDLSEYDEDGNSQLLTSGVLPVPSILKDAILTNATSVDEVYAIETVNVAKQQQEEKIRRRKFFLSGCATSTILIGAVVTVAVVLTRPSPAVGLTPYPSTFQPTMAPSLSDPGIKEFVPTLSPRRKI